MYIEPNTNIRILKDCPLDPTYDHTLYWKTVKEQTDYFTSIAKFKLTKQTYQRVQRGTMRVGIIAEQLYDCNYIMFQNEAFGNKWFYAFIKGVEYFNNATSEITFEIDVLQTWFFDYNLGMCFVEREHSVNDNVGENTVPEDLEQGPYVMVGGGQFVPKNWNPRRILMLSTFNPSLSDMTDFDGEMQDGVFTGLCPSWYETPQELELKINEIITKNKIDGVVGLYMCPIYINSSGESTISKNYSLNGYTPKNAKLFTSPYNVLHIYNGQQNMDLSYELFSTSVCNFQIDCTTIPEPIIQLMPISYAGGGANPTAEGFDTERRLAVTHFPQCTFNSSVYRAYLAEYAARIPIENYQAQLGVATSAASIVPSLLSLNAGTIIGGVGGVASSALQVMGINARRQDIRTKPAEVRGTANPNADWVEEKFLFKYKKLTIRAEYAKIIDDYFTMFGYATHRVKVPNRNSRPHWNYVKTVGCVLEGSIPADDVSKICEIYNNGITFWHNAEEIGDYSLDNRPAGVG